MTSTLCVICPDDRALNEVFKLFDLIHIITTDHKTVARITKEVRVKGFFRWLLSCISTHPAFLCRYSCSCQQVIEDFVADNVVYLELRTTPKVYCILCEGYSFDASLSKITLL